MPSVGVYLLEHAKHIFEPEPKKAFSHTLPSLSLL